MARTPRRIRRTKRELVKRLVAIAVACRRWRDTRRRGARRAQKFLITSRAAYPRTHASARWLALCAAGGGLVSQRGGCTETRPLTQDLRAAPCRPYQPLDPVGRLRGARRPDDSLHRPLARRPGWRLVPACGNQEVEARRSADAQASSGSCCVKALHRSHLEAGDMTGASRPRAKSIPGALSPRDGARKLGEENTALGAKERLGHHGAPRRQCAVPLRET